MTCANVCHKDEVCGSHNVTVYSFSSEGVAAHLWKDRSAVYMQEGFLPNGCRRSVHPQSLRCYSVVRLVIEGCHSVTSMILFTSNAMTNFTYVDLHLLPYRRAQARAW